ncbi:MAG: GDYXXLXY domain-containing protein [Verrucomicrobia bacterium]|nr:GDYXXLXY domain-containing protein [Verrucomicrobiota bacterium]
MNRRLQLLILLGAVILAQLSVPLFMIQRREITLCKGDVLRFRTEPVDPYDAFRGRYVALRIDNTVPAPEPSLDQSEYHAHQAVFVLIETDAEGYSRLASVSTQRPRTGLYLRMQVSRYWDRAQGIRVEIPFDRYYLNEKLAPEAERLYREHSRRDKLDAFVQVRVRRGFAVLEELYIGQMPIHEFMQKNASAPQGSFESLP